MRAKSLKTRDLILSLSKDEAKISCFFTGLRKVKAMLAIAGARHRRRLSRPLLEGSDPASE
jgi:hypothetical protein